MKALVGAFSVITNLSVDLRSKLHCVTVYLAGAGAELTAEQGVAVLMAVRRPCSRLEGVGSSHRDRSVSSTHRMIASPFLGSKYSVNNNIHTYQEGN